jgi:hypothetical protein
MLVGERTKLMVKHRTYSVEFKRQIAQEHLGGETLHGMDWHDGISSRATSSASG